MKKFSEKKFLEVSEELENLNETYVKKVDPEKCEIWLPNDEIRMWSIPRRSAELLKTIVAISQPKTILELGTSSGYSSMWMASAAKEYGGEIYTIELTDDKTNLAKDTFKRTGLDSIVHQIQGEIGNVLNEWNKPLDFVFMDADKINYLKYMKQMEPHLNEKAVLVADNASDFGHLMKDYLEYVKTDDKYHSYLLDIDNGLMVTVKK